MEELQKNDIIETDITSLGINGEGISHLDGKTIFVRGALPGERVRAKIILVKPTFDIAILEKIILISPDRVDAPCPHFGKCGGCDVQHLCYDSQLAFKRDYVAQTLQKVGKISAPVQPVVASEHKFRYRNKVSFPVRAGKEGVKIGLFAKGSHRVVETNDCLLQYEWNSTLISVLKKFMSDYSLSGYDEDTGKGDIRHLVVRQVSERIYVTLVTNRKINCAPLYKELSALFPNCALYQNVNRRRDNVILGDEWQLVGGEENASVDNMSFALHPAGFYQVNDYIRKQMYSFVASLCEGSVAIEAYSGAGLLSARLAQKANRVYGIEINEQAHLSAQKLAKDNGIDNFTPILGDVSKKLGGVLAKAKGENTFIVVDPPRTGLSKEASVMLGESNVNNIVYISCNPATLARDLAIITPYGYEISLIQPYDMFPQTSNVETVVVLRKQNSQP